MLTEVHRRAQNPTTSIASVSTAAPSPHLHFPNAASCHASHCQTKSSAAFSYVLAPLFYLEFEEPGALVSPADPLALHPALQDHSECCAAPHHQVRTFLLCPSVCICVCVCVCVASACCGGGGGIETCCHATARSVAQKEEVLGCLQHSAPPFPKMHESSSIRFSIPALPARH
ncbi:hypothetical protein BDZ45DRAFT_331800 [Acephala macrosclerotiorum]|nr:hypothetical protein BDZ45DRAFT_331800 [Acephala macrosclerotiorum]